MWARRGGGQGVRRGGRGTYIILIVNISLLLRINFHNNIAFFATNIVCHSYEVFWGNMCSYCCAKVCISVLNR